MWSACTLCARTPSSGLAIFEGRGRKWSKGCSPSSLLWFDAAKTVIAVARISRGALVSFVVLYVVISHPHGEAHALANVHGWVIQPHFDKSLNAFTL